MGQTPSKPGSPKVFSPETPTVFSEKLSDTLTSSPESDYTRSQYSQKFIEEQVAQRLYQARVDADAEIADASKRVPEIDDLKLAETDSLKLKERLDSLQKELDSRPKKGTFSKDGKTAQEALIKCFEENKDRPLNCREAFAQFQQQVQKIEQSL